MSRQNGLIEFKEFQRRNKDGADAVFTRMFEGRKYKVYACLNSDGNWEQWGARTEVLCDNTADVEEWAERRLMMA